VTWLISRTEFSSSELFYNDIFLNVLFKRLDVDRTAHICINIYICICIKLSLYFHIYTYIYIYMIHIYICVYICILLQLSVYTASSAHERCISLSHSLSKSYDIYHVSAFKLQTPCSLRAHCFLSFSSSTDLARSVFLSMMLSRPSRKRAGATHADFFSRVPRVQVQV